MTIRLQLLCLFVFGATSAGCLRGFDWDSPCDGVDCDDGNICTSDRCTFDFSRETRCVHTPVNEERECGFEEGSLVCREGLCGAESLCAGVSCDDDNPCTVDACDWDGECRYAPVECDDGNDCTDDRCDPETGACVFEPGDGFGDGWCFATDPPTVVVGECAADLCADPCDPTIDEPTECPILDLSALFCCPGSEYCRPGCAAEDSAPNGN